MVGEQGVCCHLPRAGRLQRARQFVEARGGAKEEVSCVGSRPLMRCQQSSTQQGTRVRNGRNPSRDAVEELLCDLAGVGAVANASAV
jgi:hypothetical protein